MTDLHSKIQRSKNMSAIRSSGNVSTELRVAKLFRDNKIIGWRRNIKNIYGKPDFVFPKQKIAVFADGCFWHGCKTCKGLRPSSNQEFWLKKIARNKERDAKVNKELRGAGWTVLRVWEHSLNNSRTQAPTSFIKNLKERLTIKR